MLDLILRVIGVATPLPDQTREVVRLLVAREGREIARAAACLQVCDGGVIAMTKEDQGTGKKRGRTKANTTEAAETESGTSNEQKQGLTCGNYNSGGGGSTSWMANYKPAPMPTPGSK